MNPRYLLPALLLLASLLPGCPSRTQEMQEGYYTAEAASFDAEGWKDFITIYVSQDRIVTVEYNARNASGLIKSWDVGYTRRMKTAAGTYPNRYFRAYAADLLLRQDPAAVRVLPGAEDALALFRLLAEAAIAHARTGDKSLAFIEPPLSGSRQ
jgi:major membrane immunogen (membrane-anchored lipoprotein)